MCAANKATGEKNELFSLFAADFETHLECLYVWLDQFWLLLELVVDSLYDYFFRDCICSAYINAQHDNVECSWVIDIDCHLCYRSLDDVDVISLDRICNNGAVYEQVSARFEVIDELVERWSVHYNEVLKAVAYRSSDRLSEITT